MRIDLVTNPDGLRALRPIWTQTVLTSPSHTVFLTWEWMQTWVDVLGASGRPYVIVVRDQDGEVQGLAPLFRTPWRRGPFALSSLRLLGTGVGADHMGFVHRSDHDVTSEVLTWLIKDGGAWDFLDLTWMEEGQALRVVHTIEEFRRTHVCLVRRAAMSPVLRLPNSWEGCLKMLSPSFRSSIGRFQRKLEREHGPLDFRQVTTAEEFEHSWEVLVRLHQSRWSTRGYPGAFANPHHTAFHRRFGGLALARGWLRFYTLQTPRAVLAALYCFSYGSRVSYFRSGFDTAWSRYGPGRLLMAHAIRRAVEEGATVFDFLRGAERHKLHWNPDLQADYHITIFRRDPWVSSMIRGELWLRRARDLMRVLRSRHK